MEELINLLPEGASVSAVIIIVIIFLKHMRGFADRIENMGKDCHANHLNSQKMYQEQINTIVHGYIESYEKTSSALTKLEASVTALYNNVSNR